MFETMRLRLRPTTRAALLRLLTAREDRRDLDTVVDEILLGWLEQVAITDPQATQAAARGYQWRSLFLPEGTCVRFEYKRRTYHAHVRGDRLLYQDQAYSPRQLLLHVTGTVRNAWRELWLRSPGDARWHLANTRRHILRRTPQGRHPRGIDTPDNNAAFAQQAQSDRAPSSTSAASSRAVSPARQMNTTMAPPPAASPTNAFQSGPSRQEPGARPAVRKPAAQHPAWRAESWPPAVPPPASPSLPASTSATSASTSASTSATASASTSAPTSASTSTPTPTSSPPAMAARLFGLGPHRGKIATLRAFLYRDDLVRDDQPDLSCRTGGAGPVGAGRSGPSDRRYSSYLANLMAARCAHALLSG
ncbi:hypothetical protein SAMN05428948_5046 [Massilia sp. CF038]|nr:hypothetical protein SAMN05428948_5046 [Massilia sp. CF038]